LNGKRRVVNERNQVSVRSLLELFRDSCDASGCGRLVDLGRGLVATDASGFGVKMSGRRSFEVLVTEIQPRAAADAERAPAIGTTAAEDRAGTSTDGTRRRGRGGRATRNRDAAKRWRAKIEHSDSYEVSFLELFQDACLENECGQIVGFREALSEATGESGFNVFTADRRLFEVTVVET
jgi:hypothetical protein